MKLKMVKKLLAVMCAITATGSTASVVGAVANEENVEKIIKGIEECDVSIQKLENKRNDFHRKSNEKLQELKKQISENRQMLDYIKNLMVNENDNGYREGYKQQYDNLQKSIDNVEKEKIRVENEKEKMFREIDESLKSVQKKRNKLLKTLNELFDENAENKNQNDQQNDSEQQTIEMWKQIASGCQYDSNGQFENLCWLFSATNVINYFDEVDINNKKGPAKGIDNVVDRYFDSNSNLEKLLNKEMAGGEIIEKYLNMNGIKTCSVLNSSSFDYFGTKDETKQAMTDIVKTQISMHFKDNKNRVNRKSPVLCCKNFHWVSVVGYFENTGNVVVVDSNNGYKKDSKIYVKNIDDFIKTNLINEDKDYGFTAEMIFSSKDEEVDSKSFDVYSVDNFEKMDEVNNMLSTYF